MSYLFAFSYCSWGSQAKRDPRSPVQPGLPSVRAAGDAEVWPAGAGRLREGGPSVRGRGRIPFLRRKRASAHRCRQHLSGDPSCSARQRPDPATPREGRADRWALLPQLHYSGRWPRGREGRSGAGGLVMPSPGKTFPRLRAWRDPCSPEHLESSGNGRVTERSGEGGEAGSPGQADLHPELRRQPGGPGR